MTVSSFNHAAGAITLDDTRLQEILGGQRHALEDILAARALHMELSELKRKGSLPAEKEEVVNALGRIVRDTHELATPRTVKLGIDPPVLQGSLEEITARTPLLKGLVREEKVEPFTSAEDLRRRLKHARRAIFAWPDPYDAEGALISVQVAFTQGVQDSIQKILQGRDPIEGTPDTAMFYSISSWERVAYPLGGPFILATGGLIREIYPHIRDFSTLSPVPKFRNWVEKIMPQETLDRACAMAGHDGIALPRFRKDCSDIILPEHLNGLNGYDALLQNLCALFVTQPSQKGAGAGTFDPVARFHQTNGAAVGRVLLRADFSEKGVAQAFGCMANYYYDPAQTGKNAAHYISGRGVTVSEDLYERLCTGPFLPGPGRGTTAHIALALS